jgi:hypothetical protein
MLVARKFMMSSYDESPVIWRDESTSKVTLDIVERRIAWKAGELPGKRGSIAVALVYVVIQGSRGLRFISCDTYVCLALVVSAPH